MQGYGTKHLLVFSRYLCLPSFNDLVQCRIWTPVFHNNSHKRARRTDSVTFFSLLSARIHGMCLLAIREGERMQQDGGVTSVWQMRVVTWKARYNGHNTMSSIKRPQPTDLTSLNIGRRNGPVQPTTPFRLEFSNKIADHPVLPWPLTVSRRVSVESRTVHRLRPAAREVLW